MTFAKFLKKKRKEAGMTRHELSKKIGVSHGYISNVEKGYFIPSAEKIKKISDILGDKSTFFRLSKKHTGDTDWIFEIIEKEAKEKQEK